MSVGVVLLPALPATGVLAGVARQMLLNPARPAKWRYAFASEHHDARQRLHEARKQRRRLYADHRRAKAAARRKGRKAKKASKKTVRDLTRQKNELLDVQRGTLLVELGHLHLHEHTLRIWKKDTDDDDTPEVDELALAGLRARVTLGAEEIFIRVTTLRGESVRSAAVWRSGYSDDEAAGFEASFDDAAVEDQDLREDLDRQAADIDTEIERIRAGADAAKREAQRKVGDLIKAHHANPQRIQVDADWEEQRQNWRAQAGLKPVWWWRW